MKIFISQPMRNKTQEEIVKERENIIQVLKDVYGNDMEVFELLNLNVPEGVDTSVYYLAHSIKQIAEADKIVFVKGFERARGCMIEHAVASSYEKSILYLN